MALEVGELVGVVTPDVVMVVVWEVESDVVALDVPVVLLCESLKVRAESREQLVFCECSDSSPSSLPLDGDDILSMTEAMRNKHSRAREQLF